MENTEKIPEGTAKNKTFKHLHSSPLSSSIGTQTLSGTPSKDATSQKKIVPTSAISGLREELKKIFLPLLIDIFELRQIVENYKTYQSASHDVPLGKMTKSPQEILQRLEQLQKDVEESQRWCNGVILQVAKGIEEAKEVMSLLENPAEKKQPPVQSVMKESRISFLKKFLTKKKNSNEHSP